MWNSGLPNQSGDGSENPDETGTNTGANQPSSEQQLSHCGAFSMLTPNQAKRQQILDQARRETDQYEAYKKQHTIQHVSYVGTPGGGQKTEAEVRREAERKQATSKLDRMKKQQQWREEKKQREDSLYSQKKVDARKQTELKEQKAIADEKRREGEFREDMRRKNNAFLDRLERSKPVEQPALKSEPSPAISRPTPEHVGSGQGSGTSASRPNPFQARTRFESSPRESVPEEYHRDNAPQFSPYESVPEEIATDSVAQFSAQTFSQVDQLTAMFPTYSPDVLQDILEQTGSVDSAVMLLTDMTI